MTPERVNELYNGIGYKETDAGLLRTFKVIAAESEREKEIAVRELVEKSRSLVDSLAVLLRTGRVAQGGEQRGNYADICETANDLMALLARHSRPQESKPTPRLEGMTDMEQERRQV